MLLKLKYASPASSPELELTDTQRFYAFKDGSKHYILFHPDRDNDAIGYHTNTARETIQEIR